MRSTSFAVMFAVAIGCTKPNPEVCCATTEQCDALGVSDLRPCDQGQACRDFKCVAAECVANADCDMASPICSHGLCVSTCFDDTDCMDVAGRPHCTPGGECVGCVLDAQCPNICDAVTQTCRGCERDDECASGACIEADGTCAEESSVLYVQSTGGADVGTCTQSAPCATLGYAVQRANAARNVIQVRGATLAEGTVHINRSVTIDASGTSIGLPDTPAFALDPQVSATIEGLILHDAGEMVSVIELGGSNSMVLGPGTTLRGRIEYTGSSVTLDRMTVEGGTVSCSQGTLGLRQTNVTDSVIGSNACALSVDRSRFESGGRMLSAAGGNVDVRNSLFVQRDEYGDSIAIEQCAPGSGFRFNTVVNVSGISSDGQALFCDATVEATSNVFAYASAHPMGFPNGAYCHAKYSLFDTDAVALHTMGEGNKVAPAPTFFVDRAGRDFHLAAGCAAIDAADQSQTIDVDLDGSSRPAGHLDMGAFEAH